MIDVGYIKSEAEMSMVNSTEEMAKALLDRAMKDVRQKRRAQGQLLHGWKREAAILALTRALTANQLDAGSP
jgi:hypothetical protein